MTMNSFGAWCAVLGFGVFAFAAPIAYFLKYKEASAQETNKAFQFILLPAQAAQAFFNVLWGKVGRGWFGVLSVRSFFVTLGFSVVINLLCIRLILSNVPPDAPTFDLNFIGILYSSELWFIFCNFLGDLFSVNITRLMLHKIIHTESKTWRYVVYDFLGVVGGYLLMILPGFLVLQFNELLFDNPNEMIQAGMAGNVLIPFFLGIFAVASFPSLLTVFALLSVLSITVPTGTYLFLFVFFNAGRHLYHRFMGERHGMVLKASRVLMFWGGFFSMLGSALLAVPFLWER